MAKYVVDTNLYIDATHVSSTADELKAFYARFLPFVHLHAVVAQEILFGAVEPEDGRDVREELIAPFEDVGRVITPTHATWKRSAEIALELIRKKQITHRELKRPFVADCLIAASAKEHGFILVTNNTKDFALIRQVESFRFVLPWPRPPRR